MVARKLDYYLWEAETTIRSDHLPLKSFLLKNTKNDKVNNWGVELASKYTLNFEYVKGVKNTLADTMSRLDTLDPDIILVKEPEGYQFGKQIGLNDDVTETEVKLISLAPVTPVSKSGRPMDPIPDKDILQWGISPEEIIQRQNADKFCQSIRDRITKAGSRVVHPYYLEEELLMRYVEENKQRFEVIVIPWDLSKVVLKLAHDDLGHNGSARTYMVVRRNYYWKGLRPDVVRYVKRCTICRKYNSASPKYNKGTFQAPGAPMDFISMDLIGEFHPPSTHGNKLREMIDVSNFQVYTSYHVAIAQTILSRLQTGSVSIENNIDKIFEYLRIMSNRKATSAVIPPVALRRLLLRIEDRMRANPRLRLPYDPRAGEIWKYYGVTKITPIVMDKMLVILMTIPVLDKTLELNIYQVHNLPAIPPGQEVESLYQLENKYFAIGRHGLYVTLPPEQSVRICLQTELAICILEQALYPVEHVTWCVYALFIDDEPRISRPFVKDF